MMNKKNNPLRTTLVALAMTTAVGAVPVTAYAQQADAADTNENLGVQPEVKPVGEIDVDATTTASTDVSEPGKTDLGVNPLEIDASASAMTDYSGMMEWEDDNVTLIRSTELSDARQVELENLKDSEMAADLQASINANAELKAKLEAENAQIENIVEARTAADGSMVFYQL